MLDRHDVTAPGPESTTGELVAVAATDLSLLIREEIELARAELTSDLGMTGRSVTLMGAAGACSVIAVMCALVAGGLGFAALGLPHGTAFLVVAGCCLLVAGGFATFAVIGLARTSRLRRTKRTCADTVKWLADPTQAPDPELEELRARHE